MVVIKSEKSEKIKMLDTALNVLDYIFKNEKVTFTKIKEDMNIPKSTLHRLLYTLENKNYILKDKSSNEYSLGLLFAYYGEEIKSRLTLKNICESYLVSLATEVGETVNLNILFKENVLNILTFEGEKSVLTSKLMPISPLNCSSSGKIFLALKDEYELKRYFTSGNWEKRTANSIVTYDDFIKERSEILDNEISYDREEYEYGLFCIAKPLKNHNGLIDAVISITGPTTRMKMKSIESMTNALSVCVNSINEILVGTKYIHSSMY